MIIFLRTSASLTGLFLAGALALGNGQTVLAATSTSSNPNGFRGVFQFTNSPQVNNASLAGGVLIFNWADLEPKDGDFRWDLVDAKMLQWTSHGKKVAIRLQTASRSGPAATPTWLFNLGVPSISQGSTKLPVYWSPTYLHKLQEFSTAFGARYDGNPGVAWLQGGVGISSETKIDDEFGRTRGLPDWRRAGYTDAVWLTTIQQIVGIYQSRLTSIPVAVSVANSFPGGTPGYRDSTVVDWLAANGAWPQNDSLSQNSVLTNANWMSAPNIQEQFASAAKTGDSLLGDLKRAIAVGGTYALIFGQDISNRKNQGALSWAAAQVST